VVSPLAGSIAKTIGKAFNSLFLDATLTRDVAGVSPDPADPVAPTQTTFACKAIVEVYSDYLRKSGLVNERDRKVLVLASTLSTVPKPDDRISISGIAFTVMSVATDPATATWEIQGRM
jgi:hypothetical protein